MTNEQIAIRQQIRDTFADRLAATRALPDIGWVLGLASVPAFYVDGGKTLAGLEHATVYPEPRGAWNIRNGAGERLVWSPIRKAKAFQIRSLEKADATLDEMFNPVAATPTASA